MRHKHRLYHISYSGDFEMGVYAEPFTATWVCKPLSTHDTLACCWYSLNMNIKIKLVAEVVLAPTRFLGYEPSD